MARKKTTIASEDRKIAILETIVLELKSIGTDATNRSANIGRMCVDYMDGTPTIRPREREALIGRLKAEGLDHNITRHIKIHGLVKLVPEAISLPIGVAAKIMVGVKWKHPTEADKRALVYQAGFEEHVPNLVRNALQHKWNAEKAGEEVAKVRKPRASPKGRKAPATLRKALQTIGKADMDAICSELTAVNMGGVLDKLVSVVNDFAATKNPFKIKSA